MGQFLEKEMTGTLRSHYRTVAVQIYYIFEVLGVEQIARTIRITSTHIRNLSQTEYLELVSKSLEIFNGVENLVVGDVMPNKSCDKTITCDDDLCCECSIYAIYTTY
jgi:hypothetical protein